ncbi:MAG: RcpC/CpaB family pilus assembly protein [Actinomycetota bacterium]
MKRRIIALVAALLLAGVGTFVLIGFVQGAEDRATAGQELVTVYIVQSEIPQGTLGADVGAYIAAEQRPVETRPSNAVTDTTSLDGLASNADIFAGEVLVSDRWVLPTEAEIRREDIPLRRVEVPEGHLEIPVRFASEQALGGIIDAGDTVAVVASFDNYEPPDGDIVEIDDELVALPGSTLQGANAEQATHIIIHNALIVEVQAEAVPSFGGEDTGSTVLAPQTGFIITFALEPGDVERLVFSAQYGQLWLAKQTEDDTGPTSIVTLSDVFEGP